MDVKGFFYWIKVFIADLSELENHYEPDEAKSNGENEIFEENESDLFEESK